MARLKNSLTFQHSGPEFRAGQGQDFFYYSFSEMQPLVYLTSFAPSLSSQHRSILRCLSEEFSTYRAHPQRSALLFHHLSTPPLRAPLPRGTESPTAWWPLAGRSGCRDSLVAPASISIDTAAGPAVNPGGVCAESHQVAPGLRRDGGTLMSPGLLTASGTGRWLRLSHRRFRGSAPQSN